MPFMIAAGVATLLILILIINTFRYIPNNRIGVVEKRWSAKGSVEGGLIALKGEAGFQPVILRGGWHLRLPFIDRIHTMPLVTIPQGKIGYVFARDGHDLPATQSMASNEKACDFQDATAFLAAGGQKGPQRQILREGTYAVHGVLFVVLTEDQNYFLPLDDSEKTTFQKMSTLLREREGFSPVVIEGDADLLGIVTIHDGPSLSEGEIIAPTVGDDPARAELFHNNFQDADKFLRSGGRRGRQYQVLVDGTYYLNRLFSTVEYVEKTIIDVGHVGVVVSYTGEAGTDTSGSDYRHGELVARGQRGVWNEPLLPGKYAFNVYAGKVISVPTTNFILKWKMNEVGSHNFDENLKEVTLITKDAFEPSLPLSVVVHIDYLKAPLVIQRFGDVKKLVEQTLDPMVSAYFKNIGQTRTLIQLLQDRSQIQQQSAEEMKNKFRTYNLELQEVLIGTPSAGGTGGTQIEEILTQLRSRQIAEEKVETYTRQQRASIQERELKEAESRARQQTLLTESEISISVQSNQGKAELARAQQEASRIQTLAQADAGRTRILAEGEAQKIKLLAEADAERAERVGIAEAHAVLEKVKAYGGPQFQLMQQVMNRFAEAIEQSKVDVVPKIQMGQNGGGGLVENLLAVLMSDKVSELANRTPSSSDDKVLQKPL